MYINQAHTSRLARMAPPNLSSQTLLYFLKPNLLQAQIPFLSLGFSSSLTHAFQHILKIVNNSSKICLTLLWIISQTYWPKNSSPPPTPLPRLLTFCKIPVFNLRAIWKKNISSLTTAIVSGTGLPAEILPHHHPNLFYKQQLSLKNANRITLCISGAFLEHFVWNVIEQGFLGSTRSDLYLLLHIFCSTILPLTHCASVTLLVLPLSLASSPSFLWKTFICISFGQKLFLYLLPPRIYLSTLYQLVTYSSLRSRFNHHFYREPIQSLKTFCSLIILLLLIYWNMFDIYILYLSFKILNTTCIDYLINESKVLSPFANLCTP